MKLFSRLKKKWRGSRAFTVAELLVGVMITSFAGLIVIGGLAVVTNSFQDLLLHSQAQMVLKEYMGEVRSGFLSADLDSAVVLDTADSRPAFTHSGFGCAGYYTVINANGAELSPNESLPDDSFGSVVFQPVYVNQVTGQVLKDSPEARQQPALLISSKLAEDYKAYISYKYDETTHMFTGTVTVKSAKKLSSGSYVQLSGDFSVSPICRQ